MEKSFALSLANRPGTLRKTLRILWDCGVSVTRASYNQSIDVHALFVDITGTRAAVERAEQELHKHRLYPGEQPHGETRLLDFELQDEMGSLDPVLALIDGQGLNITHFDVRSDGFGGNTVRIGVHIDRDEQLQQLLDEGSRICKVHVVERETLFNVGDSDNFIRDFAQTLARRMNLSTEAELEIMVNANRIAQNHARKGSDPYKSFEYLNETSVMLADASGPKYDTVTRVSHLTLEQGGEIVCVEPPVGCTTWALTCENGFLVFDAGFRCCAQGLDEVLARELPCWRDARKVLALTHADLDHVGDTERFDEVCASGRVIDSFMFESMGIVNWREQNPLIMPYNFIAKLLCSYEVPDWQKMRCFGEKSPFGEQEELFRRIDTLVVAPYEFEVWEGKGGHVRGEIVFIERAHRLCVSGDILVNIRNQTKEQTRYNALAPFLLGSVDAEPMLAREERQAMLGLLEPGRWLILAGHGGPLWKDIEEA